MQSDEIRQQFVQFFVERGHKQIPSASLVPHGDPTLLFTSAGMVPFKPYFLGLAEPPARRITTVQKCFRTSDIDRVGDGSHLTFFEMLGNFSIGDYFKAEAIAWAWELVTKEMGVPVERLWTAVYLDDDEAFDLWRKQGVPAERIRRYGEEQNYWFSGETGPCGPCSEIFFDFGEEAGCRQPDCGPAHDCGRFLEIWNLVFMTYFQHADGSGRTELPTKNIDTGAGLERWAVVQLYLSPEWQQNEPPTVYDTDLFRPIIEKVAELANRDYDGADEGTQRAMRIVAEHARAAAFLIADGVLPSNEGRGYVLRRLIRRAVYHARTGLVWNVEYMGQLVEQVIGAMSATYPELREQGQLISRVAQEEEQRFGETLGKGESLLHDLGLFRESYLANLKDAASGRASADVPEESVPLEKLGLYGEEPISVGGSRKPVLEALLRPHRELLGPSYPFDRPENLPQAIQMGLPLTGEVEFLLWDTYGLPPELTEDIAARCRLSVTESARGEFESFMEEQRARSRAATSFELAPDRLQAYASLAHVRPRFVGYDALRHESTVAGIVGPEGVVEAIEVGQEVEVVLHETPFYPEGGGQVGDTGEIAGSGGRFAVEDTQAAAEGLIVHSGRVVEGRLAVNDAVVAQVDAAKRAATMRHHTATHLLHAALRSVLGEHAQTGGRPAVRQSGSLVAPDRLRFDFTHVGAPTREEMLAVERLVNEKVRQDLPVEWHEMSYEDALAEGALALFDEKYAARVRVVEMCLPAAAGEPQAEASASSAEPRCFSKELCGGTHCHRTGEVGAFVIISEGSIGAGLRRLEALAGEPAVQYVRRQLDTLEAVAERVGASRPEEAEAKLGALQEELAAAQKRFQQLEREAGRRAVDALLAQAERVDGVGVLAARVPAQSFEAMREMGDLLRDKLGSAVVVLGAVFAERPNFLAMVTSDLAAQGVHAGELIKRVAAVAGGGGGGRPEMAQAGGKDPARLDDALRAAVDLAREALAKRRATS